MTKFSTRRFDHNTVQALINRGYSEPLARALSARSVKSPEDMNYDLHNMLAPERPPFRLPASAFARSALKTSTI